jgi:lysophospholipase L1-like esterase
MGVPPALPRNSKLIIFGYLLHLAFPSLILADIVTSWSQGEFKFLPLSLSGAPVIIAAGISALWLLAGLGLLFAVPNRQTLADRVASPLLGVYSVAVALLLVEAAIRLTGLVPAPNPLPGQHPGKYLVKSDPAITPGVSGLKTVTMNDLGLRGHLPPQGRRYNIVAIGGSTTIEIVLDDSESWPQLLENDMNASQSTIPVWVGNAGRNGANSVDHLVLTQWLPGVVQSNMWVFLTGINDLQASLAFEGASSQAPLEEYAGFQGDLPRGKLFRSRYPRFRRLKLFVVMEQAVENVSQLMLHPAIPYSEFIVANRKLRAQSAVVPLPDLSTGLKEYRSRLISLASRCREINQRCLFLTQPTIWRDDLGPAEQRLLWFGYVGHVAKPKGFASVGDLARAMSAYNQTLLDVCQQSGLECFDLASHIPKTTSFFYDDVHFNENGARLVAQVLQQYLLSTAPFRAGVTNNSKPASSAALESVPFIRPDHP